MPFAQNEERDHRRVKAASIVFFALSIRDSVGRSTAKLCAGAKSRAISGQIKLPTDDVVYSKVPLFFFRPRTPVCFIINSPRMKEWWKKKVCPISSRHQE